MELERKFWGHREIACVHSGVVRGETFIVNTSDVVADNAAVSHNGREEWEERHQIRGDHVCDRVMNAGAERRADRLQLGVDDLHLYVGPRLLMWNAKSTTEISSKNRGC